MLSINPIKWFRPRRPARSETAYEPRASLANPDDWLIDWFGGGPQASSGVRVTELSALSASAVFAAVRNLAEDCAKLPLIVYRRISPMGKERFPQHPLYRLLHDSPNPESTAFDFRQAVTGCAVLFGNGYAEIERTGDGTPVALWWLEPWRVRPKRDESRRLYYEIDGGRTRLDLEDVLHVRGFSLDGVLGCMIASHGRESLGLTLAAQKFAASFFGNGARLSGHIELPNRLSPEAYSRLKASWSAQYGGTDNAHRTAILEEGAKYVQDTSAPEEAQMLETRQFQVEDVARWFRMPPHKLGHLLRATGWSTLEATNTDYVTDTLMPWFVRWEQEIRRKLLRPDEADAIFAEHLADGLMRGDATSRANFYRTLHAIGAISDNEIRALENMNPIPGGDRYYVPLNMVPADRVDEMLAAKSTGAATSQSPPATDDERAEGLRLVLRDAFARIARREIEVIRSCLRKRDAAARIDQLYAEHAGYARQQLRPALMALGHDETRIDAAVQSYIARSRQQIADAIGAGSDAVAALLDRWESSRAEDETRSIYERDEN